MAKRFGVVDNLPPYPAMALGAGETTALRMAAGYAQIVNGGKKITPTVIDRVQDKTGVTVFKHDIRPCDGCSAEAYKGGPAPRVPDNREQIIDSGIAYQMLHILEGVVERGTATTLLSLKRPLAGKTGTTNDYTDAWFVGMTPDLVIATYIGFDQPRTLGKNETGGGNVVPIFKDLIGEALEGTPAVPFRIPPGIRMVRVNRDTGKLASADDRRAIYEAFRPGSEPNADEPEDEYQADYGSLATGPVTSGEDAGPILGPAPVPGAAVAPPAPPVPTRAFGTGAGGAASGIY
jgi:penicillin-binding protein 1A